MTPTMLYDAFICHASEDKDEFVRPLADRLRAENIEVWYDEFSLKLGDSIRRSIEIGLGQSRFGIVVLSTAFFAKQWPQYELDGLAEREMRGNDRVLLPIWHGVTHHDVMQYSAPLAGRRAVSSSEGIERVVEEIRKVVHPQESPLIVARDTLLEWGVTPPVITHSYWLDVVEASNRVPGAGPVIPDESHWGRWSFPLPAISNSARDRGERLAWTSMQLTWTSVAEEIPITPLTPPNEVHDFIGSQPGLWATCSTEPRWLIEYAPQLTIRGYEGDLLDVIQKAYEESLRASEARRRTSPTFGVALTNNRKSPLCEEEWALRHPKFGGFEPAMVADAYFTGGIFGPDVSPYEHADHLFWLLSRASEWLPVRIRKYLKRGMAEWAVWTWHESHRGENWQHKGQLFEALHKAVESRHGVFRWTNEAESDLIQRIERSVNQLQLPETAKALRDVFVAQDLVGEYIRESRDRRVQSRRREAAQARAVRPRRRPKKFR